MPWLSGLVPCLASGVLVLSLSAVGVVPARSDTRSHEEPGEVRQRAETVVVAPGPARPVAVRGSQERYPARFTAPYVEGWGSPDVLERARRQWGLSYFTLGFVISDGGCEGAIDGTMPLAESEWPAAVARLRAVGGDVIVSLGGGAGTELARACASVDDLVDAYRRVVEAFGLPRIDLDIEGPTLQDGAANERRNEALARLQREYAAAGRQLAVQYTLPTHPHGLSEVGLDLLRDARERGVDVSLVNIMTMDYGPDLDMGRTAIRAAAGLHGQLAGIWPDRSERQLWAMEGNTPMVGVNDAVNEVFSTADAAELAAFADEKGIRMLSYWGLGRDRPCPVLGILAEDCSGTVQDAGDFARVLRHASTTPPDAPGAAPPQERGSAANFGRPLAPAVLPPAVAARRPHPGAAGPGGRPRLSRSAG
ncbi:chitinase [Kitasatospora sp. NPDC058218]|uniref:chitinase n=1 Tax=Kitasatospora sp. NPDC058218 TaxID=3346385 RepID=UPI0036DED8F9